MEDIYKIKNKFVQQPITELLAAIRAHIYRPLFSLFALGSGL
jgi:hypothetical protein